MLLALVSFAVGAQTRASGQILVDRQLPDAPTPQIEVAAAGLPDRQDGQQPAPASAPADGAQQGRSSTQSGHSASITVPPSKGQTAAEQVRRQEKQRVLGILPTFSLTYLGDQTVSLTAKQKFDLAIHSSADPTSFVIPFFVAGFNELQDDDKGFPWGMKGLGERAGAAYLDALDGNMIGNAILPSILHQDPRYFRLGHGGALHRVLYAAAAVFICKHDNTGRWEPNYSNVGGNIAAGALSNLYYPSAESGVGLTFTNGFIVTAEGAIGSELNEFWPDLSRRILHKDPTRGLDAQMKAEDEKKKAERTQR